MKVLQISQAYSPSLGGVEKHLDKVNQQLLKHGHQVAVLCGDQRSQFSTQEKIDGVSVFRLNNQIQDLPSIIYKLKIFWQVIACIKLFLQADVVQVHDVFWWILPIYPLIAHKVFIIFHGYEGHEAPSKKAIFWHRLAWKLSRASIAVGGFHQRYYGISADQIIFGASDEPKKNNPNRLKKQLIFLGRLSLDNGIMDYLKALKILKNNGKNYQLNVFGDGPLLSEAKAYVKKEQLKVVFKGMVDNTEQFLADYPIALVSRYLAIIEALKNHCQVIAHYNNQIKKDYLTLSPLKNFIILAKNPQAIARAIINQETRPEIDQKLAQSLTWSQIAEIYQNLWQKKSVG